MNDGTLFGLLFVLPGVKNFAYLSSIASKKGPDIVEICSIFRLDKFSLFLWAGKIIAEVFLIRSLYAVDWNMLRL